MVDVVDTATRSRMMAGIKGKNTQPERLVRSLLHRQGFRFRLNVRELPGKPDIVLPRYHAVIFVNGCFWHGHDCARFKWPKTRTDFWRHKIEGNRANDQKVTEALLATGWRVGIVWECSLKGVKKSIEAIIYDISDWLRSDQAFKVIGS
ncbi:MAG: very short patch repair endonuclease [Methylococcaceae bacterium]